MPLHDLREEEHPVGLGPESDLRMEQLSQALRDALQELPLKCQQVFLWNKIEGYTQKEIAEQLGLTSSSVEKYMKRALRHLQKKLQNYAPH